MDKGQIAIEYFKSGLNCCQAVVLAFKDEIGLSSEVLKKASIGFGGGLGRQRLTCGAVSGMCMVISFLMSDGNDKLAIYPIIQQACNKVKDIAGSITCAELIKAQEADAQNSAVKKLPCDKICYICAQIASEICGIK